MNFYLHVFKWFNDACCTIIIIDIRGHAHSPSIDKISSIWTNQSQMVLTKVFVSAIAKENDPDQFLTI